MTMKRLAAVGCLVLCLVFPTKVSALTHTVIANSNSADCVDGGFLSPPSPIFITEGDTLTFSYDSPIPTGMDLSGTNGDSFSISSGSPHTTASLTADTSYTATWQASSACPGALVDTIAVTVTPHVPPPPPPPTPSPTPSPSPPPTPSTTEPPATQTPTPENPGETTDVLNEITNETMPEANEKSVKSLQSQSEKNKSNAAPVTSTTTVANAPGNSKIFMFSGGVLVLAGLAGLGYFFLHHRRRDNKMAYEYTPPPQPPTTKQPVYRHMGTAQQPPNVQPRPAAPRPTPPNRPPRPPRSRNSLGL